MQSECEAWAKRSECKNSKRYMEEHCRPACGLCKPVRKYVPRAERNKAVAAAAADGSSSSGSDSKAGDDSEALPGPAEAEAAAAGEAKRKRKKDETLGDLLKTVADEKRRKSGPAAVGNSSKEDVAQILEREAGGEEGAEEGGGKEAGGEEAAGEEAAAGGEEEAAAGGGGEEEEAGAGKEEAEKEEPPKAKGSGAAAPAAKKGAAAGDAKKGVSASPVDRYSQLVSKCALLLGVTEMSECIKAAGRGVEYKAPPGAAVVGGAGAGSSGLAANGRPLIEPIAPEDRGGSSSGGGSSGGVLAQKRLADVHARFHPTGGGHFENILAGAQKDPQVVRVELVLLALVVAGAVACAWRGGRRPRWLPTLPRYGKDKHLSE
jgi:hypothetical protein